MKKDLGEKMKLSDLMGVFNKSKAKFISAENIAADFWVIKLKPADGLTWRPGEHGVFTIPGKDVKGRKWRAFSVASIPEEGHILLGTRTGNDVSSFKKVLTSLKAGDLINVHGPFGWFVMQDSKTPVVLICSGVGVTPIRALFKEIEKDNNRFINLIHASNDYHLFKGDITSIADKDEKITLQYTTKGDELRIELKKIIVAKGNSAFYYVSGSPKIMRTVIKQLKDEGIKGKRIINDPFFGY